MRFFCHIFGTVADETDGLHAGVWECSVAGELRQALHSVLEWIDDGGKVFLKHTHCNNPTTQAHWVVQLRQDRYIFLNWNTLLCNCYCWRVSLSLPHVFKDWNNPTIQACWVVQFCKDRYIFVLWNTLCCNYYCYWVFLSPPHVFKDWHQTLLKFCVSNNPTTQDTPSCTASAGQMYILKPKYALL